MANNKNPILATAPIAKKADISWNIDEMAVVESIAKLTASLQSMSNTSRQMGIKVSNLTWGSGTNYAKGSGTIYTSTTGNYSPWKSTSSQDEERTYFMGGPLEGQWRDMPPVDIHDEVDGTGVVHYYGFTSKVKDGKGYYRVMLYDPF